MWIYVTGTAKPKYKILKKRVFLNKVIGCSVF